MTEPFVIDGHEHQRGPVCDACYAGYPTPDEDCQSMTGYMHASYGDESRDGDYWLYTRCDTCGEPEE